MAEKELPGQGDTIDQSDSLGVGVNKESINAHNVAGTINNHTTNNYYASPTETASGVKTPQTPVNSDEEKEEGKKNRLIKEIKTQGAENRNLKSVDLSDTNLRRGNFSFANLRHANLRHVNLSDANFRRAYLNDANLRRAYLNDANLKGANLSDANLSDANLSFANLKGANLSFTNLSFANLRGVNLSFTNLRGANVEGTRFGYNQGMSESMRNDLISRGAIFEDSPEDYARTNSLVPTR